MKRKEEMPRQQAVYRWAFLENAIAFPSSDAEAVKAFLVKLDKLYEIIEYT